MTWEPPFPPPQERSEALARAFAPLGRVYLRPMHEMNGDWYPWAGDPAAYVASWRQTRLIFKTLAPNVRFVWSVNNFDVDSKRPMEAYWPGREYVDIVGIDGYAWHGEGFRAVFRPAYMRLLRKQKPVWITEAGVAGTNAAKRRWVRSACRIAPRWKRLKAFVWFNEDKERDWRWPLTTKAPGDCSSGASSGDGRN